VATGGAAISLSAVWEIFAMRFSSLLKPNLTALTKQLHTSDQIFHLALDAGLLVVGLFKGRHRAKAGNHET